MTEAIDFDRIAREEVPQAARIAEWFFAEHREKMILDVGCGPGLYTDALRAAGLEAFGVDNDPRLVENAFLTHVDVTREMPDRSFDVVLSLEVAEHIPEDLSTRYLAYLVLAEPQIIYFSAARPGQRGEGHVNCQSRAYWCARFHELGYWLDPDWTDRWLTFMRSGAHMGWLTQNGLVLRRAL